jgi:hypothetical protein
MNRALFLLTVLVCACVILGAGIMSALPHSDGAMTYDPDCCHNMDCAPVDKVEQVPTSLASMFTIVPGNALPSTMVVTTKHGTVAVPPNFPLRQSKDARMHACIRQNKLICLYMPPGI